MNAMDEAKARAKQIDRIVWHCAALPLAVVEAIAHVASALGTAEPDFVPPAPEPEAEAPRPRDTLPAGAPPYEEP
jgi:hypothetical protein